MGRAWAHSFLEGVVTVSGLWVQTTRRIQELERTDTERLMEAGVGNSRLGPPVVFLFGFEHRLLSCGRPFWSCTQSVIDIYLLILNPET